MTVRRAIAVVLLTGVGLGGATALVDRVDAERAVAVPWPE